MINSKNDLRRASSLVVCHLRNQVFNAVNQQFVVGIWWFVHTTCDYFPSIFSCYFYKDTFKNSLLEDIKIQSLFVRCILIQKNTDTSTFFWQGDDCILVCIQVCVPASQFYLTEKFRIEIQCLLVIPSILIFLATASIHADVLKGYVYSIAL